MPKITQKVLNIEQFANAYLESIPVEKVEDFRYIYTALKILIKPSESYSVSSILKGRISNLKEMSDKLKLYIQDKEDFIEKDNQAECAISTLKKFINRSLTKKSNKINCIPHAVKALIDPSPSYLLPSSLKMRIPIIREIIDHLDLSAQNSQNYLATMSKDNDNDFYALNNLTDPKKSYLVSSSLKDRITVIKEIVEHPEFYVEDSKDYEVFKKIFIKRVEEKRSRLWKLTPLEKEVLVRSQEEIKEMNLQIPIEILSFQGWLGRLLLTSTVPQKYISQLFSSYTAEIAQACISKIKPTTLEFNAEYVEDFANSYLNNIFIEEDEWDDIDFDIDSVVIALESLIDPSLSYSVPFSLEERINVIREKIDHPEFYVEDSQDYPKFKEIFLEQVFKKRDYFKNLSIVGRNLFLLGQDNEFLKTPDYLLSFEEWLRKMHIKTTVPKLPLFKIYEDYINAVKKSLEWLQNLS